MKKAFIILSMMAVCAIAGAQSGFRYVYIPGAGERQFGFSLSPTYCAQHIVVKAEGFNSALNKTVSYDVDGMVNNHLGYSAGLFYGYETTHGRALEWGNYASLYYGLNPFHGTVTINRNGVPEEHKISYTTQYIKLHVMPFLTYNINEEFSVSAGLGFSIAPTLSNKLKLDRQAVENISDQTENNLTMSILGFNFDANVGMKYWLTDEWFIGARVQYSFLNLLNILGREENNSDFTNDALKEYNGAAKINLDNGTGNCLLYPKNYIQTVFSIGYTW